ncbi:sodium-dependent glucose transporter 1A-like isoform X2 [Convolutriloba macropyga]|uniref:sodium-dependent glucose transporter 1A-like isoform X2 n=1 Tax=Convolutriloba macropyga TaxID=536237 RepID=UPI003F527F46
MEVQFEKKLGSKEENGDISETNSVQNIHLAVEKENIKDKETEPDQTTQLLKNKTVSDKSTELQEKSLSSSFADRTWKHRNFSKIVHTIILYCVMLGMGSMHTVVGPTLLDLAYKLDASVSEISVIYTTQGLGFIVGTIAGGLLMDIVPKMVFLMVVTVITAMVTVSIPHWPNVWSMCICFFLRGTSIRALEIGCNVTLLDLWGIKSSRPMQGLHFFMAIGCAIGPLIVQPFLGKAVEKTPTSDEIFSTTFAPENGSSLFTDSNGMSRMRRHFSEAQTVNDLQSSEIELAYMTIGIYLCTIVVIALFAYICSPKPESVSDNSEQETEALEFELSPKAIRKDRLFKAKFIFTGTVILFLYFGSILSFDSYLTTFCVESKLKMSQSKGAVLSTVFWSSFILARLIACFYAGAISDLKIIIVDLVGIVLSALPMSFFVQEYEFVIWLCIIVYGFFMASLGPAAISYTNMYIDVSGKIAAVYMLGAAIGETVAPFIIGKLFEMEPMVLMYTVTTISVMLIPLTFICVKIAHKRGKKLNPVPSSTPTSAPMMKRRSILISSCEQQKNSDNDTTA